MVIRPHIVKAFILFYPITIMPCSAQYLSEECVWITTKSTYLNIRNSHILNHSSFFLGKILCFRVSLNFVTLVNQKRNAASYIFVFYIPHMCGWRVQAFKISFPASLLRCCLIPGVPEHGSPASPQAYPKIDSQSGQFAIFYISNWCKRKIKEALGLSRKFSFQCCCILSV